MKNTTYPLLLGSALLLSNVVFAEESDTTISINCSNNEQKKCVEKVLVAIKPAFKVCDSGLAKGSLDLQEFANVEIPDDKYHDADMAKNMRSVWINGIQSNCAEEKFVKDLFDPTEKSSWGNQLMLGYTLQSDYNVDGVHEGFGRKNAFAQFAFNGRWMTKQYTAIHWGVGGLFANSAVLLEEKDAIPNEPMMPGDNDSGSEGDSTGGANDGSEGDTGDNAGVPSATDAKNDEVSFNDVNGSLDIYTKLTFSTSHKNKLMHDYFTYGLMVGLKTREKVTASQDTSNSYGGFIGEYLYFGEDMSKKVNTIPRGKLSAAVLLFEEYGGQKSEPRLLLTGEWQLDTDADAEKGRFVVGFKANVGKGADDIAVFFAYRSGFDSIKSFITGG